MSEEQTLLIVGAGTMGHGIATVAALAGYDVRLCDVDPTVLERAIAAIEAQLAGGVQRGKFSADETAAARQRIQTTADLAAAAAGIDLLIEAVPERMELKQSIFQQVAAVAPDTAVLATNTSSLSVTALAGSVDCPERVLGMHFFNPPIALKLLEIVRTELTSEETLERARAAGERMNREIVVVKDSPGFASSRLGVLLGLEAIRMVEEGVASPADIDRAMEVGYRLPMGPLRLTDLVGLDVRLSIAEYLHAELGTERFRPPELLRQMVRDGKLGKKSGEGFYVYA